MKAGTDLRTHHKGQRSKEGVKLYYAEIRCRDVEGTGSEITKGDEAAEKCIPLYHKK